MNKWFRNVSYTFLGKITAMALLMGIDIVAARFLGVDAYAEWVYYFAILTMLFWVGWFGINASTKVHVSKYTDRNERMACIKSAFFLRLAASLVISITIFFLFPPFSYLLGYPNKYPNLQWLFMSASILVFLNSFSEFYKQLFIGTEKYRKLFIITVTEYAGYLIFSMIGLLMLRSVRAMVYGYIVSGLTVSAVGWFMLTGDLRTKISKIGMSYEKYIKPIFKYAIPIAFISLGGMILVEMDTFMLGLLSTKENVAVYSIAKNLSSKAIHVNNSLIVGVMTSFSVITADNIVSKKADYRKMMKINYAITGIVGLSFVLFSDIAIKLIYGQRYAKSGSILRMLAIYYALLAISTFYSTFLDFRNKAGKRSICYTSVVIINLVLNYLWIPPYGAVGAAWATNLSLVPYTVYVMAASGREWKKEILRLEN